MENFQLSEQMVYNLVMTKIDFTTWKGYFELLNNSIVFGNMPSNKLIQFVNLLMIAEVKTDDEREFNELKTKRISLIKIRAMLKDKNFSNYALIDPRNVLNCSKHI